MVGAKGWCRAAALVAAALWLGVAPGHAQAAGDLQIFGFFQNAFMHQTRYRVLGQVSSARNSFGVQQHNLFLQKDLDPHWRAFVNYELLNSFSSARRWGSANLEEAWVRYRASERFSLKLGLSIPVFNNLNEIKNRTPVLPYIVRPLVYESSFSEFIAVEEYLPARAYVQAYGFAPVGNLKVDYALFLGNGPNLNDDPEAGQTGVDTTTAYLVGGRLGLRRGDWKAGLSASRDHVNAEGPVEYPPGRVLRFERVTRRRLGADLSWLWRDLSFEAEAIAVAYDDDTPGLSFDKEFYYATLGWRLWERLLVYGSYWLTEEEIVDDDDGTVVVGQQHVEVPTAGAALQVSDRIVAKAQFAPVDLDGRARNLGLEYDVGFNHLSASVSVVF